MADRSALAARYDSLDRALQRHGFPATSEWWLKTIRRFLLSKVPTLVLRVGRRGGKSSTLCRLAVLFALYVEHPIPPGDRGVVAFVSTRKDEAASRLFTIATILRALEVPFTSHGDFIDLDEAPIRFAVFPCTVSGVSGPTCVAVFGDELAKWRDADTGANPATEVLAALRPTMATQPDAVMVLSSSPLGLDDAHAKAFARGDTDDQITAFAETWVANPTVTKERTKALESDERVWRREYAAIPQASALAAFPEDVVLRAFIKPGEWPAFDRHGRRVCVLDPSSGRKDAWTWGVAGYSGTAQKTWLVFDLINGVEGRFFEHKTGDEVVDDVVADIHRFGVASVHADQREAFMLESAFNKRSLTYHVHTWLGENKVEAVARVRRWLAEGTLLLPEHANMKREMLAFEEKITAAGAFTFGGRGAHDDYVALLLTAAMADIEHGMSRPRVPGGARLNNTGGPRDTSMLEVWSGGTDEQARARASNQRVYDAVHGTSPSGGRWEW